MVDIRLFLFSVYFALAGCGTVPHIVEQDANNSSASSAEKLYQPITTASAPAPAPVISVTVEPVAVEMSEDIATTPAPKKLFAAIKKEKFIDKVTSSVMSAAEAAVSDKKETVTYDANGDIKEKTVEIDKGSFVENMTKLFALLSATLGLYIGVKKFRQPDLRKV